MSEKESNFADTQKQISSSDFTYENVFAKLGFENHILNFLTLLTPVFEP